MVTNVGKRAKKRISAVCPGCGKEGLLPPVACPRCGLGLPKNSETARLIFSAASEYESFSQYNRFKYGHAKDHGWSERRGN